MIHFLPVENERTRDTPEKNEDLHGNAPDKSQVALLLVSIDAEENEDSLKQMEKVLKADIRPSNELDLEGLRQKIQQ